MADKTIPKPSPAAIVRAVDAKRCLDGRRPRVRVAVEATGNARTVEVGPPHNDAQGFQDSLRDAFGTASDDFIKRELQRLGETLRDKGEATPAQLQDDLNAALAVVDGIGPENEIEAMLGEQMAATHAAAMKELGHLRRSENIAQHDSHGSMANKLLRTYAAQIEALAKLKRGGEQTVRVVHVHSGGQAIVGTVTGGGGIDERGQQTDGSIDARALAFAPGAEVFGEDAGRDAVPAAGRQGQEAVQAPRRRGRDRRAPRRA